MIHMASLGRDTCFQGAHGPAHSRQHLELGQHFDFLVYRRVVNLCAEVVLHREDGVIVPTYQTVRCPFAGNVDVALLQ